MMDDAGQIIDPNKPEDDLAEVVEEVEEKQDDFQAAYNAGGHFKEQLEAISQSWPHSAEAPLGARAREHEIKEMEEILENPEIGPEVESHLEKIEKDPAQMQRAADDYVKAVGMKPVAGGTTVVPLTDDQIKKGLHHKVWEAMRWLAEWCVRRLKMVR